ncbi:MAG TPA: NAD(P)-dependent oxidoreductase [Novosphingobium sp.]|nr:NAD(P)-dependent oxidoreductase [Novosphingobium sp.]
MTRILLTGGTGFVGQQVLRALLQSDGVTVTVLTRQAIASHDGRLRYLQSPDLFAQSDSWYEEICRDIDVVIHCAWYVAPGDYQSSDRNLACLRGTLGLAEGAAAAGVQRFVGVGTCLEYAFGPDPLTLDTPLAPTSPYAAAKAAAFLALSRMLPARGTAFAWCRLFYLYGQNEDPQRLVAGLRTKLARGEPVQLTQGRQIRDFLDVATAGERIASIALSAYEGAANVCSGLPVTVRALAESIADEFCRRDLLEFGARPENAIDPPVVLGAPTAIEANSAFS